MHLISEQNIFIFLVQVFILLALSRGLGELFTRHKQPAFTAEILAGVILGPTILGRLLPNLHNAIFPNEIIQQSMLETVAWLGLLFFLLNVGLEVDFSSAWKQRSDALTIAIIDMIVPLTISFTICLFLPDKYLINPDKRIVFSLFMAIAMTISAMPIAARALHDLKISKTDLGFLIVSALSVNDIIGWLIFTVVLGLFTQTNLGIAKIFLLIGSTIAFAFFALVIGRNFVNFVLAKIKTKQALQPATTLTFICLLGLLCGAITQKIGIHALFGFFIAGVMAGEARALPEKIRQTISQMVYAIFVPLFFAGIGLRLNIFQNFDLLIILFVTFLTIGGKFLGAWLGTSFTHPGHADRLPIAISHIPGGSMEIVIGLIAFEYKLIPETVFIAIVFGAVISAIIFGPLFSYSLRTRKTISILEFLSRRAIIQDLRTSTRDDAILKLCELAADLENIPESEYFYDAVLKRENIMGTAIEEGLAVPHARLEQLKRPIIVFGRSVAGIEWDSPDGKPSQFIFLILTSKQDDVMQVQILSLIAKAISIEQTRNEILEAKDADEIWAILQRSFTASQITQK